MPGAGVPLLPGKVMTAGNPAVDAAVAGMSGHDAAATALLWALHQISGVTIEGPEIVPMLRDSLGALCEAGHWSGGHALLPRAGRLMSAGAFHGDLPALSDACTRVEFAPGEG